MPANLSPEYIRLEGLLKEARSPEDKLPILREMLRVIPKHKGTDKLQADLKRRISRLQETMESRGRAGGRSDPFHVPSEGAGQAALAGPPNSGKSTILEALTGAEPAIADFPFTTTQPQPGMVPYEDIQIQLVDGPPLVRESMPPGIINLYRNADLLLLVADLAHADPLAPLREVMALLDEHLVSLVAHDAEGVDPGQVARVERRTIVLANKVDEPGGSDKADRLRHELAPMRVLPVSFLMDETIAGLPPLLFSGLHIIRLYTKKPGYKFERSAPYILEQGATVIDAARSIHKDFAENLKEARIWGSAKHDGQAVPRDHVLADGDIIEFHV
ncbi:MAG: TGS domain-containing protein [Candidatus Eisenbacteria bacterium]|nr:TGS domain-containing protein [Candidatus Eisenbacteria bacterium]